MTLRTDNGGEYTSTELKKKVINHETTVCHSPQQNGIAMQMNRPSRKMHHQWSYTLEYPKVSAWAEGVCLAAYIRNRVITTASRVTPYELWYSKKPEASNIRVFECTAYTHIPDSSRQNLDSLDEHPFSNLPEKLSLNEDQCQSQENVWKVIVFGHKIFVAKINNYQFANR